MKQTVRIATRKSPLALYQAQYVKDRLLAADPDLQIRFVGLSTAGDREPSKALADIGGKSLFVKELQSALLENNADIAVHSIKDMSAQATTGLCLAAICQREDPRDVIVSPQYQDLNDLPPNAIIGTTSPRRIALLQSIRTDLRAKTLRGNVGTRLDKLDRGDYDAIILAAAGLIRLGLTHRIASYLDPRSFIPAIGQAAIGVECRENDTPCRDLLSRLNHPTTAHCIAAERAVNQVLGGDCYTPLAAHAVINNNQLHLHGMVGSLTQPTRINSQVSGAIDRARELGKALAQDLLDNGAAPLLKS
jgi:hydroxymethylbilane synthase